MEIKLDDKDVKKAVDTQLRVSMMEALGKNPDALIKSIVNEALSVKKNSYDNKTVFQTSIDECIRDAGKEVFKAWVETKKQVIKDAIVARLNKEEGQFIETIADKLVNGMADSFYVSVYLKTE